MIAARFCGFAAVFALLLIHAPAQPRYAATRAGDVVQLQDAATHMRVSILPSVGNIAFEMQVNGQNILWWPFQSVEAFEARPAMSGIPFVGPWANRLDEQAFYANGRRYPFDMSVGNVRGATPIHGFLTTTSAWRLMDTSADVGAAWATSRLDFGSHADWMKQWPFAHTIEMTHRLANGALEVETRITNTGVDPMPIAIGFHPYVRVTDAPRADWTFAIAARTHWLLAPNKIPTGDTEPIDRLIDPAATPRLRDYNLDDVFSDLVADARGRATMRVGGRAQRIDVELGPRYRAAVVWAPNPTDTGRGSQRLSGPPNPVARGEFICFEPMAAVTDALNLAHRGVYRELQYVAPAGEWRESFWIRPSGF